MHKRCVRRRWSSTSGAARTTICFTLLTLVVLLAPAGASSSGARPPDRPTAGPLPDDAFRGSFRDRVLSAPPASAGGLRAQAAPHWYYTPDGYVVEVEVSSAYIPDPAIDQAFVNFLASHLHSYELGKLKLYIGPPPEIEQICGALACYVTSEDRMYIPGEESQGIPIEYPITHEYGHHLASWRLNAPWYALDWGPKYWASYSFVCAGVIDSVFFPGDQGAHYFDDPGEGFADAYAHYHYPNAPWQYNQALMPDAGAFRAIERDTKTPWTTPKVTRFKGRLSSGRRSKTFALAIGLDGEVTARLQGPRRADYNLELRWRKNALARTRRPGSRDRLTFKWCRDTSQEELAKVRVTRKKGAGSFRVKVSHPGY
jgi:hypothetical protein